MGLREGIRALAEHWESVRADLSPADRAKLAALVDDFVTEADPTRSAVLARRLLGFLGDVLDEDHPVFLAQETWELRWKAATAQDPRALAEWFTTPLSLRAKTTGGAALTADQVGERTRRWLLAVESLADDEVRDASDPDLIRLHQENGAPRLPSFQFDEHLGLLDVVRRVNHLLEVVDDPWGVADWWLGENTWLGGESPAGLIGRVDDQVLVDAATRERAEM